MDMAGTGLGHDRHNYPGNEICQYAATAKESQKNPYQTYDGGIDIEIMSDSDADAGNHLAVLLTIKLFAVTHSIMKLECSLDLDNLERLNHIAFLDVVVTRDTHTAFLAGNNFLGCILDNLK